MSKIFYDHLVIIDDVITEIDMLSIDDVEKKELKNMIDSIIHHQVLEHILDLLSEDHHEDFLEKFHSAPYDVSHINYLEEKIEKDVKAEITLLGNKLKSELLDEIRKHKKNKRTKTVRASED